METLGSTLPELDAPRGDDIAAPVRGNLSEISRALGLAKGAIKDFSIGNWLALTGRPSARSTGEWPRGEIGLRFLPGNPNGVPGDHHLAIQGKPWEEEGNRCIARNFESFAAFVIGEEE